MNKKNVEIKNINKPKRVLTCGDIHGALKALIQCLERCNFDPKTDELIFLGDYVDGFSESSELIEYLIELEKSMVYDCIFILGNHDCVDSETELFTNNGWKYYNDILNTDLVVGINEKGESQWQNINQVIIKESNHLNYYSNIRVDLAVTDNHRILFENNNNYNYIKTKDLKYNDRINIPLSSKIGINTNNYVSITSTELKLAAWILTDGHINKNNYISIYQSKINTVIEIKKLLLDYNAEYTENIRNRTNIIIKGKKVKGILKSHEFLLSSSTSKRIINTILDNGKKLPSWINLLHKDQLEVFLSEVLKADGSKIRNTDNYILYGTKSFLSSIQPYFVLIGYSCNLTVDNRGDYRLNISHNKTVAIRQDINKICRVEGKFTVWCLSVPLTNFMVRRNGKVHFTGNCWCKDWLNNGQAPLIWTQQGGQSTIDSYIRTGYLTKQSHRDFFNACNLYYIDEQNRGFVHGGYNSRKGLGHETYESDYYWDRDLWNLALMQHKRFHDAEPTVLEQVRRFEKHKEVFIGHTSTNNWNIKPHYGEYHDPNQAKQGPITVPMNRCNVWNLDTGCGFSGKLTIMDINTKEYFQSDFVKELYPNEHGRN